MPTYNWQGYPQYPNSVAWGSGHIVSNPTEQEVWGLPDGGLSRVVNGGLPSPVVPVAYVSGSGGSGSSGATVNKPANIVAGNLLVAVACYSLTGTDGSTITAPSGWVAAGNTGVVSGAGGMAVFTKVATGSEPSTYTFGPSGFMSCVIDQYSGTVSLDGLPVFNHSTSPPSILPSVTPSASPLDGYMGVAASGSNVSFGTPGGLTAGAFTGASANGSAASFHTTLSTNAATGTFSSSNSGTYWTSASILLAPTPVPPTVVHVQDTSLVLINNVPGSISFPVNTTVDNVVCLFIDTNSDITTTGRPIPSGGGVSTWNLAPLNTTGTTTNTCMYYGKVTSPGSNTISISDPAGIFWGAGASEFSNVDISSLVANVNYQTNGLTSITVGPLTPTAVGQLVFVGNGTTNGVANPPYTAGAPWTMGTPLTTSGAVGNYGNTDWLITTSTAPVSATYTYTSFNNPQGVSGIVLAAAVPATVTGGFTGSGTAGLTVGAVVTTTATVAETASAGLTVAGTAQALASVALSGVAKLTVDPVPVNPAAWYDATRISGVADGASLASWPDRSGNGNDMTQSNSSAQPTYLSTGTHTINGLPVVSWGANNPGMVDGATTYDLSTSSIFAVAKMESGNTATIVSGSGAGGLQLRVQSGTNLQLVAQNVANIAQSPNMLQQNTPYVLGSTYDQSVHAANFFVSSTAPLSAAGATGFSLTARSLVLGYNGAQSLGVEVFRGSIGEVLVYNRVLDAGEIDQIVRYLQAKWAVPSVAVGAVIETVTGGLTVGATVTTTATVSESATAGMTVGATALVPGTVSEAATAGLTVSATVTEIAAVTFAPTASLTVGATVTEIAAVALTGVTSLTVVGTPTRFGTVALSGTAGMTVGAVVTELAAATLTAVAGLAVSGGGVVLFGTVSMAPVASLTVAGLAIQFGAVSEIAVAGMTVAVGVATFAIVSESAVASLTVAGLAAQVGTVIESATAGLVVAASIAQVGAVTESAIASLVIATTVQEFAAIDMSATASLNVLGIAAHVGAVVLTAVTALNVQGTVSTGVVPARIDVVVQVLNLVSITIRAMTASDVQVESLGLVEVSVGNTD